MRLPNPFARGLRATAPLTSDVAVAANQAGPRPEDHRFELDAADFMRALEQEVEIQSLLLWGMG